MRRTIVGIASLSLLLAGGCFLLFHDRSQGLYRLSPYFLRSGMVLGGVWLVWPEVASWNPYFVALCVGMGAAAIIQPHLMLYVGPALAVLWLFFPRRKRT